MTLKLRDPPDLLRNRMTPQAPRKGIDVRKVVVVAYDGLGTFEFGVAVELFGLPRPELGPDWYRFAVAAVEPGPLRATGGFHIEVDGGFELLEDAGTIIVPGWRDPHEAVPPDVIGALKSAHGRGARLMSICSGVFVLAATGLLDGRRATTHWRYTEILAAIYPKIEVDPDVLYVDGDDILTSAGSAAGIDLGLHVIRKDFGPEVANNVARRLVLPPHREGGQAQFVERAVAPAREAKRLAPLFDSMRKRLQERQTIAHLASEVGMSQRTFLRRFKAATGSTPADWLLLQRLSQAKELLETTTRSIQDVASSCGLGSAENLRHHFRQQFRTSPSQYRSRFHRESNAPVTEA
jgi:AraC family transcriptional activator FtrA